MTSASLGPLRVAGFGFRQGVTLGSLRGLIKASGQDGHLSAIATAADKAQTPAFQDLARSLGLPVIAVPLSAICAQTGAAPAPHLPARYGHKSLAEAAALAASGPQSRFTSKAHHQRRRFSHIGHRHRPRKLKACKGPKPQKSRTNDRSLHRSRSRCRRSDHLARARSDRHVASVPLRRLFGTPSAFVPLPKRRAHRQHSTFVAR